MLRFPTRAQQCNFVLSYLHEWHRLRSSPCTEADLERSGAADQLCREAVAYTAASHIFWGLWSILQAARSEIVFPFMEYARVRLEAYQDCMRRLLDGDAYLDGQPG